MSDLWGTPQDLFDKLHREFNFTLDVCALPSNAKCDRFFSPDIDGLSMSWNTAHGCHNESVWMNPPYGREIEKWMQKAYQTSCRGVRVVALIPNRSNAPWWHEYVMKASEIRFVKHKVSFEGEAAGVPFWGSVIAVFGPGIRNGSPMASTYTQPKHDATKPATVFLIEPHEPGAEAIEVLVCDGDVEAAR